MGEITMDNELLYAIAPITCGSPRREGGKHLFAGGHDLPIPRPNMHLSTGRGISSLWGVQFSPLGGLAISRFLDQRLRFSAVDHDA